MARSRWSSTSMKLSCCWESTSMERSRLNNMPRPFIIWGYFLLHYPWNSTLQTALGLIFTNKLIILSSNAWNQFYNVGKKSDHDIFFGFHFLWLDVNCVWWAQTEIRAFWDDVCAINQNREKPFHDECPHHLMNYLWTHVSPETAS